MNDAPRAAKFNNDPACPNSIRLDMKKIIALSTLSQLIRKINFSLEMIISPLGGRAVHLWIGVALLTFLQIFLKVLIVTLLAYPVPTIPDQAIFKLLTNF
jgi:hypothetical protein